VKAGVCYKKSMSIQENRQDPAQEVARSQNVNQDETPLIEEQPTHSEDGVDLTLIRWMLSLTPAERLQTLQQTVWSIMELRGDETKV
jgi:hypothetical protein